MAKRKAGDQLTKLLLPYCRPGWEPVDGPGPEVQWWFTAAPPAAVRAQAEQRGGLLAGFAASGGPDCPRMRVDAAIVPASQAEGLADEIAGLWPIEEGGTALDLAVVEGLARKDTDRVLWALPGSEFRKIHVGDWLDAAFCSFWWD